jgi:hypothetical protein
MVGHSAAEVKARLDNRLLEREPNAVAVDEFVRIVQPFAGCHHQALVALPFGGKHSEAELAFLVLGDPPEACGRAVVSLLQPSARNAGDAIHLRAATTRLDRNRVGSKKTCLPQIVLPSVMLHLAKAPRRSL